jgi:hypothetical protein
MKKSEIKVILTIGKTLLLLTSFFISMTAIAQASQFNVTVTTILASNGNKGVDRRIGSQVQELQAAFRYSSYQLVNKTHQRLALNQTGNAPLPGGRALSITPLRVIGNRAKLKLAVFKNGRPTFQTVIQLLNQGRIIVGGPQHSGGVIIFIISNSF